MAQAHTSQIVIIALQWMPAETLNSPEMTAKVIGKRPNTYTFTKVG